METPTTREHPAPGYDPQLTLKEFAQTISALGMKKANTQVWQLFLLAVLAGLYISFGAHLFLVALEQGAGKVVAGAVFSVGLVLVVVAGAELFTGNIIMVVGALTSLFPLHKVVRNWVAVYAGNLTGAYLFALLIWHAGLLGQADSLNSLGMVAVKTAEAKLALTFTEAMIRGILCNMLVLLAIIMATLCKDVISKIVCCLLPVMTFVASGFEHCVANMYLIPVALLAQETPLPDQSAMFANILPVTLGNLIGGLAILIGHPNRIRQLLYLARRRRAITEREPGGQMPEKGSEHRKGNPAREQNQSGQ